VIDGCIEESSFLTIQGDVEQSMAKKYCLSESSKWEQVFIQGQVGLVVPMNVHVNSLFR
jgi:hypothetical protein